MYPSSSKPSLLLFATVVPLIVPIAATLPPGKILMPFALLSEDVFATKIRVALCCGLNGYPAAVKIGNDAVANSERRISR